MSFLASSVHRVVQRGHDALRAPVGHQTLGSFHDEVGCAAALDGGVDLIVAVGIVQILDGHLDVRVLCIEAGDQLLHGLVLAPAADGVCPQLDACAGGAVEAAAEAAVLVEAEEPPQAVRAAVPATAAQAVRNERREIFFIVVTSYNKIVVFIDRSPAECYNSFRVLWIGEALLPQRRFLGGSNHSFFVEMLIS